jgi:hypothetical protein
MRNFIVILAISVSVSSANGADFNITVQPLTLAPGQSGLLEVDYTTNSSQQLALENFGLLITANNSPGLHFVSSPDPSIDSTFPSPNYIFAGNSADFVNGIPLAQVDSGTDQKTYGADATISLDNTTVATSGLLGFLPVTADHSAHGEDTFTVSLINDPLFTQFSDQDGNLFTFAGTSGLVTIAAIAVPEPSTWALALVGLASLAVLRRRRQAA